MVGNRLLCLIIACFVGNEAAFNVIGRCFYWNGLIISRF